MQMQMQMKIWNWLNDKKTYIGAIALAVLALAEVCGLQVPDYVYIAVGAATGASVRHALSKNQLAAERAEAAATMVMARTDAIARRLPVNPDHDGQQQT